ncbi:MAG: MIP family channel protein [Streptosporangiales bacterium]|nr:MIP family channel protein [Streptosporangiales bacterium]
MAERFKRTGMLGELSAEFAGTMILILFGTAVVAQVVATGGALGDHDSIAWGWGFGVVFGVYVAARISGAHINPAVTLSMAVFRDFPWRKVLPFMVAQLAGAFVAAMIVRWNYTEVLNAFDPNLGIKSQVVFVTAPGNYDPELGVTLWGGFRDQIFGTAILLFLVMALTDTKNVLPNLGNLTPFMIGLVVVAIGMAWGTNAGYAINPARDLGPRLVIALTGYETAWQDQYGDLYFWVPIVAPLLGGLLGAAGYKYLVERYLPDEGTVEPPAAQTTEGSEAKA